MTTTKNNGEVFLKDGDNLIVVVEINPSVCDPVELTPAIANTFRVVAAREILEIVPLGAPKLLGHEEFTQAKQRVKNKTDLVWAKYNCNYCEREFCFSLSREENSQNVHAHYCPHCSRGANAIYFVEWVTI